MNDLIEALEIFKKYLNVYRLCYPTDYEPDVLHVLVDPKKVSEEDRIKLKSLGFKSDEDLECFYSHKFGSN